MKYSIIGVWIILWIGCKTGSGDQQIVYQEIQGQTMGTTYNATILGSDTKAHYQMRIDSVLIQVNKAVNHYDPQSLLSQFNQSDEAIRFSSSDPLTRHLTTNLVAARRVVKASNNSFDPTVGPLVNYYGFGNSGKYNLKAVDSLKVDSIMQFVSFNHIIFDKDNEDILLKKSDARVQLDFSAIAKGYGVDQAAALLDDMNIPSYLVEIGGEVRCKGSNPSGTPWNLAITDPKIDAALDQRAKVIQFTDRAMASSGNYRNYYKVGDRILAHTIDPKTGYPEANDLLSATILHEECMYADAFATACMVMGLEKALRFVGTHPEVSYLFLYTDEAGDLQSVDSGDLKFLDL